ncbi:helix-turn-helix domain-containing protein [Lysinibacillus sp. BPa_S21]|uniref:helix-turn-helix domain-containing protein n=1 Tax=Lysinibacillus sp. BPa_S21 TaxID=2932478 RepID=UPI002012D87D|nr:helix-turn-helix transcriptional regulator [Lysinibacillus sp. BPa_S21]MCL1696323.1 helix-turn-helix domain-containing protein [Lysinibacillus sp. BPa_S21]
MANSKEKDNRDNYHLSPIIGKNMKAFRKARNLTMEEVSTRTGVSAQAISLFERSKRMPSPTVLLKLALAYQVSEDELVKLREETIIDTVNTYKELTPVSIRNEFDRIMNSKDKDGSFAHYSDRDDFLSLGDGEFATDKELTLAKAFILTLRSIEE